MTQLNNPGELLLADPFEQNQLGMAIREVSTHREFKRSFWLPGTFDAIYPVGNTTVRLSVNGGRDVDIWTNQNTIEGTGIQRITSDHFADDWIAHGYRHSPSASWEDDFVRTTEGLRLARVESGERFRRGQSKHDLSASRCAELLGLAQAFDPASAVPLRAKGKHGR